MRILTLVSLIGASLQIACGNGFQAVNTASLSTGPFLSPGVTLAAPSLSDPNVMALQVGCGYANEPCVSVTICVPGTSTCRTVSNILVDTGSYGLRIFGSTLSGMGLPGVAAGSGQMAECVSYLDNSSDWGPIATADVMLGSQKASSVRIQVIESDYPGIPSNCTNPDDSPSNVGFNGIMGVGLFKADCGSSCANSAQNQTYYSCSGSTCTNVAVAEASQVSNPIASLPNDNNGVALQLPGVSSSGSSLISGYLVFGIGTRANNSPTGATVLTTDGNGEFGTTFNGTNYSDSFIDSGSNGLYFPQISSLPTCSSSTDVSGWFCPSGLVNLTATQIGTNGQQSGISFQIGNAQTLLDSSMVVFNNVGAPYSGGFDWGLPFFLGRTVYVGLEGTSSTLASGTYWAY